MRKDAQATAFALAVFDLRESVTVVALGDAVVQHEYVSRDRYDGFFAFGRRGGQFFLFRSVLHFDLFAVRGDGLFSFFQIRIRVAQPSIDFFAGHHDFKLAVFGFAGFGFGVSDFVLQGFVSFVGFDGTALIAIFAGAFFPLLDVELEFLAFFEGVDVSFLGGGDGGASTGQLVIEVHDALRESVELGAKTDDLQIDSLEVDEPRNCRMHEGLW